MAGTRVGDIAIKVGSYESQGETKNRYQRIGGLFQGERGLYGRLDTLFLSQQVLERCRDENGVVPDSILFSVFEEREGGRGGSGGGGGGTPRRGPGGAGTGRRPATPTTTGPAAAAAPAQGDAFDDDDIPF